MNITDPATPATITKRSHRLSVATLLATAAPMAVAVAALAAAPLAASVPVAAASTSSHHSANLSEDPCHTPQLNAFNTMKWPTCAGD